MARAAEAWEADEPDTRVVLSAYELLEPENRDAPVIAATPGFSVLTYYPSWKGQPAGFNVHPVLAWQLCHGGESPFPLCFSSVKYHRMSDCAIQNPDGSVVAFSDGLFKNAATWLRDCKRRRRLATQTEDVLTNGTGAG